MDKTQIAVELFNRRAKEYQDKYMNLDGYADGLDFFCDHVVANEAEILEIACGPGNISRYVLNKRPHSKFLGTDLAPNMLELARANNPEASFELMDGRKVAESGKQYDGILCGFFLPYLAQSECRNFISNAAKALKSGGLLYLSTMEGDYAKSGFQSSSDGKDRVYIHYHEGHFLAECLFNAGLKVLDVQRQDFKQGDGSLTTDLVIIAAK